MARMPRTVAPDVPHHASQRGNLRMQTFFGNEDYNAYLGYLSESTWEAGIIGADFFHSKARALSEFGWQNDNWKVWIKRMSKVNDSNAAIDKL